MKLSVTRWPGLKGTVKLAVTLQLRGWPLLEKWSPSDRLIIHKINWIFKTSQYFFLEKDTLCLVSRGGFPIQFGRFVYKVFVILPYVINTKKSFASHLYLSSSKPQTGHTTRLTFPCFSALCLPRACRSPFSLEYSVSCDTYTKENHLQSHTCHT